MRRPACTAQGAEPPSSTAELKKLSVEELMDMEVTSVSKKEESLGSTPAAIAVVTSEDIRRAGGGLELSLTGQNLLHAHHLEFGAPASRGDVERSMWGKIAWGF